MEFMVKDISRKVDSLSAGQNIPRFCKIRSFITVFTKAYLWDYEILMDLAALVTGSVNASFFRNVTDVLYFANEVLESRGS